MALTKDSREFVECVLSNEVEFLVVGARAVSRHALPRYSGHIAFLIRPTEENSHRVLAALDQFGFGALGITLDARCLPHPVLQLGV